MKITIPKGKPNKIPSILSSIPPWPGKILPLSLTSAFLLRNETNKSPICEKKLVAIASINKLNKE